MKLSLRISRIKIFFIFSCFAVVTYAAENNHLKKVFFENSTNISNEKLDSLVKVFVGIPLDKGNARAIADKIQNNLRTKSKLNYATVTSIDSKNGVVSIKVGQYHDMDERIINEMKNHPIEKGKINRIFFKGNQSITTKELILSVKGMIGSEDTEENLNKIVQKVENVYKKHGHNSIYGRYEAIDHTNGILFVRIEKKR